MTEEKPMTDEEMLDKFCEVMKKQITEHQPVYGDTWKTMPLSRIYDRLTVKMREFDITYNKDKLISIANLCMLLYIRMFKESGKLPISNI
jgi:hypothetical protein